MNSFLIGTVRDYSEKLRFLRFRVLFHVRSLSQHVDGVRSEQMRKARASDGILAWRNISNHRLEVSDSHD